MSWHSTIHAIISHDTDPAILMMPSDDGWRLPVAEVEEPVHSASTRVVVDQMKRATGAESINFLRCIDNPYDATAERAVGVFALDRARGVALGEWVDSDRLSRLTLAMPDHRSMIETHLRELESGVVPPKRAPWARSGWIDDAVRWIEDALRSIGRERCGDPEYVKSWGISCVLKIPTDRGNVYFKVAAQFPYFVEEATATKRLAELFPGQVPPPLAIDPSRGWMLLEEFPQPAEEPTLEMREHAFRTFARLQIEAIPLVDELLAATCLDRRLERFPAMFDDVLESEAIRLRVEPHEFDALRASRPRLLAMLDELASCSLPATLVHGDLHMGNVTIADGRYLFFDWTDACVSHPFFELIGIIRARVPSDAEHLLAAYLSEWRAVASAEQIEKNWELCRVLIALHHTISYHHIISNLEPTSKPELAGNLVVWARRLAEVRAEKL